MIRGNRNHGTVLITGASSGIGRELAREFAAYSDRLVLIARRLERLENLRNELNKRHPHLAVVILTADLSDEDQIEALLAKVAAEVGSINVLVNNAGVGDSVLFDRSEWARTRQVLHTNMMAVVRLTSALVPPMVACGGGGVLNIGSAAGLTIMPGAVSYVASKYFIVGFSEALRADLAGTGVTVTQVCPGPVDSEFDQIAGSKAAMVGSPPQFIRIGAVQCAREARLGFEQGRPLVFPGAAYRFLMRLLPLFPVWLRRRQAGKIAERLRVIP